MTLDWYKHKDGSESVYWSKFKHEGDIGLITKFKGDKDGIIPDTGIRPQLEGMEYWASQHTSKEKGSTYYKINRKLYSTLGEDSPEQVAHKAVQSTNWDEVERKRKERDGAFEQRHKESIDKMSELIIALNALTDRISELQKKEGVRV